MSGSIDEVGEAPAGSWQFAGFNKAGTYYPPVAGTEAWAEIEGQSVEVYAGCRWFKAWEDSKLSATQFFWRVERSGEGTCPNAVNNQEYELVVTFLKATQMTKDGGRIVVSFDEIEAIFIATK